MHEDGFGLATSDEVDSPAGFAAWVARLTDLGMDRVLAVCAVDNLASMKTIERCGGVFEGIRDTKFGPARRYWIELLATG